MTTGAPGPARAAAAGGASPAAAGEALPLPPAAGGAAPVTMSWRRASCAASRISCTCTFQAMATTPPDSPAAPRPSSPATTGWPLPAARAASMRPPRLRAALSLSRVSRLHSNT